MLGIKKNTEPPVVSSVDEIRRITEENRLREEQRYKAQLENFFDGIKNANIRFGYTTFLRVAREKMRLIKKTIKNPISYTELVSLLSMDVFVNQRSILTFGIIGWVFLSGLII